MNSFQRLADVRSLLQRSNTDAVLMTLQKNISWFTGGRSHVNIASEPACCSILITRIHCVIVINNIESGRLLEEEMSSEFAKAVTSWEIWSWHEPGKKEALIRKHLADTEFMKTDAQLEPEFLNLRSIIPQDRFLEMKRLGQLTGEAIEQTATEIQKGDSEFLIAGKLAYRCYERGLEPIVNLVAVDERAYQRRHPLPTDKRLNAYAMVVVCARKNGLIASASRLVHFGRIPDSLNEKQHAVVRIDSRLMHATRPETSLDDLFMQMKQFYRDEGFPEEYQNHHQGGLTGYATREKLAVSGESYKLRAGQLVAWNPSIAGVKSEDTLLVHHEANEWMTETNQYPYLEVKIDNKVYRRPAILQR
ncbi:M24 family metallopeptidase [Paenibacillus nasutitermitis]|uniref:Peptidase M24 n=1 Tax=Paenibacillus nasutitermitis TaxID=1652958 RepID=A0A917DR12_9BACL|nr:aminopeptidase P family protein [Paenibacillus nasutitermitis]GGD61602.1 peptidase M24 [Paenibacillus nasutitermitis]